uniref:Glucuronosyltransferase n=1 Tax=Meloidogyne incognita TaxID=6306 RepID=A0A914L100_MELIC
MIFYKFFFVKTHTSGDQEYFNDALYAGVPLILIPFTFEEKFNAKVAEYMGVGINFDHTKFLSEFTFAVAKLMRLVLVNRNSPLCERIRITHFILFARLIPLHT